MDGLVDALEGVLKGVLGDEGGSSVDVELCVGEDEGGEWLELLGGSLVE